MDIKPNLTLSEEESTKMERDPVAMPTDGDGGEVTSATEVREEVDIQEMRTTVATVTTARKVVEATWTRMEHEETESFRMENLNTGEEEEKVEEDTEGDERSTDELGGRGGESEGEEEEDEVVEDEEEEVEEEEEEEEEEGVEIARRKKRKMASKVRNLELP